jgi:hypothetical protein
MLVLNRLDQRALSLGSAALFHDGQVARAIDPRFQNLVARLK